MLNKIMIDIIVAFVLYVLSVFIGVFLKRNQYFIVPFVFGTVFGAYKLFTSYVLIEKST